MTIDDRLRETFSSIDPDVTPSPAAWASITRRTTHRARRAAWTRRAGIALAPVVAVAVLATALVNRGDNAQHVSSAGKPPELISGVTPNPEGQLHPAGLALNLSDSTARVGSSIHVNVAGLRPGEWIMDPVVQLQALSRDGGWKIVYFLMIQPPGQNATVIRTTSGGQFPTVADVANEPIPWTFAVPSLAAGTYRLRWDLTASTSSPTESDGQRQATLYHTLTIRN